MKIKSQKGAITLYVLVAMLVFTTVAVSVFITSANRQRTQLEALNQMQEIYQSDQTAEDAYQKYVGGDVIPIYTAEQLLKIGTGSEVLVKETGKTYTFSIGKTYELKNNITFTGNFEDVARLIRNSSIVFEGKDNIIQATNDRGTEKYTKTTEFKYAEKEFQGATWAKVFYHKNSNGTYIFASDSEAQNSNTMYKYSSLESLEQCRNSDGKFEFLLEYPELTGYNRWKQTSNPCTTSESVTGYEAVTISWTDNYWGGLCKSSSSSTFIDGSVNHSNWFYSIGAKTVWNNAIPGPSTNTPINEVYLWVRVK